MNYLIKQKGHCALFDHFPMRLLFTVLAFIFLFSTNVRSDVSLSDAYDSVRASYRKLVISDPAVVDKSLWYQGRVDLENLLNSEVMRYDRVYRPRALYLLGRLNEQLFVRGRERDAKSRAEKAFNEITQYFSGDELADDALLGIARLYFKDQRYKEQYKFLNRILSDYPESNSAGHAKTAIQSLYASELIEKNKDKGNGPLLFEKDSGTRAEKKRPEAPSLVIASLENKYPVVLIDPGHGGTEDGAVGPGGIKEKDIVLAISERVRARLQAETKVRVSLTRADDSHISLADRTKHANEIGAELFVSIHANASEYKTRRGIETYYLDNTDDKSSLRLAERENLVADTPSTDLSFIISDFIQGIKMDDSITAAHVIHSSLVKELSRNFDGMKDHGVKRAPFYVLVGAHMPCVLVEVSFIDHPIEGRLLATERYQRHIADGVFEGILAYLQKKGRL